MADPRPASAPLPDRLEDIRRSEQTMIVVRWAGVVFAVVQVLAYHEEPYPPGVRTTALLVPIVLAVANIAFMLLVGRMRTLRSATTLSLVAFGVDILVIFAFVWLYAFDPLTALWAVLYIIPLEGAVRFQLAGALGGWALATALYVGRELFRVQLYPESTLPPAGFGFQPESISFRMGIALLIALVAGLMARNLLRERETLAGALTELSRIDALRARLVATLAHDVRGPLTTIRGTFRTLSRYGGRVDDPTRAELIEAGDRQAGRLEKLSADLLDLARLEEGRLQLHVEDVRLDEVLDRALSFADTEQRFAVRIKPDVRVRADPDRLEQIIVNLAMNALRYGGPPFVVEAAQAHDGRVTVTFRDHGEGVPPAERGELFEAFRTEKDEGSVGMGLAIVRALVEAQGGTVTYEPNTPRGACFRLELVAAGT